MVETPSTGTATHNVKTGLSTTDSHSKVNAIAPRATWIHNETPSFIARELVQQGYFQRETAAET